MSQLIAEEMSDGEALRYQVAELRFQNYLLSGKSDSIISDNAQAVATGAPHVRAANPKARLTVVINDGNADVTVSEAGHKLCVLDPGGVYESALNGAGEIKCECFNGDSSTVTITTYLLP